MVFFVDGYISGAISGNTKLRHFCWRNLIKMKLKAKEGENPIGLICFLVERLIVAYR